VEPDTIVQDDRTAGASQKTNPAAAPDNKTPSNRQQNPLGEYSSWTYQIVLAMITPEAYTKFVRSGRKDLNIGNDTASGNGTFLIAQSGGINAATSKRADGFELDYYIDDLKITAAVSPAEAGGPVVNTDMTFNVIEPYGFSFVTNLKRASKQIAAATATPGVEKMNNATKQLFILGIRFLGYDADGRVIENSRRVFDRYYDINIHSLQFKIDGRTVTYQIKAATLPSSVAAGTKRGMINHESTVTGRTIGEVLDQLMLKLTNDQKQTKQVSGIPAPILENTYSVDFRGPGSDLIKNALIVSKADPDKSKWPMGITVSEGADATKRTITFKNDTPILQSISQLISQSSYLEDALKVVYTTDETPDPKTDSPDKIIPDTKKRINWFNVTMEVIPKAWNPALNDFAFDIKYIIQPYQTPMVLSPLAEKTIPYYGPSKRYEYWYTGKNSEILRFEQTFNTAYFAVALSDDDVKAPESGSSAYTLVPGKRQPGDRQGRSNVGAEAGLSYVTSLYEPGAWAVFKMDILGDPDWLVYDGAPSPNDSEYSSFYGPNGFTINPTGGQVFIEIDFKEAVDYDNTTGLMDINDKILFWEYPPEVAKNLKGISYLISEQQTNLFLQQRLLLQQ
jgi:hypothetical protein